MRVVAEIVVVPDFPKPTTVERVDVELTDESLERFMAGEYPVTLQIFIESALPQLVRETIRKSQEVPTR